MKLDLRTVLTLPFAYRLWVSLIQQKRDLYVSEYVRPKKGQRILDIGCGPGDVLEYLPDVHYVGIDHNPQYIESATKRYGKRGAFKCQDVEDVVLSEPNSYDLVMANGLLHHLDDESAVRLLHLANAALKPDGHLLTFDGCFTDPQPAIKRILLRLDRGKHVRTEAEYLALTRGSFTNVESFIREDFYGILFPYTIIVMRARAGAPVLSA